MHAIAQLKMQILLITICHRTNKSILLNIFYEIDKQKNEKK